MASKKDDKTTAVEQPVEPATTGKPAKSPFAGEINPSAGKSIDERMADLLADHQRMGARPPEPTANK